MRAYKWVILSNQKYVKAVRFLKVGVKKLLLRIMNYIVESYLYSKKAANSQCIIIY